MDKQDGLATLDIIPDAQHRTLDNQMHDVASEAIAPVFEEF